MIGPGAILLDTCALIWFVNGRLSQPALDAIGEALETDGVFVSPISAWEIGLISRPRNKRPRAQFLPDPQSWFAEIVSRPEIREAPLTASAALAASFLPEPLHGDPADRLLIATARERNMALATGDDAILAYAGAGHLKVVPMLRSDKKQD